MRRTLLLCFLLLSTAAFALATPASPSVYAPFIGQWTGTLEYRDYQTNKRVKLPTTLTVQPTSDGSALRCSYVYDDGPGKTVTETETVTIDTKSQTYSVLGSGDKAPAVYQVTGLTAFTKAHSGTLVLHGSGEDDNRQAEFRKTITVTPNTLTILKEVHPPGSTFQFRNQYAFTRLPKAANEKNQAVSISVPPISRTVRPPEYLLTPPVLLGSGPAWRTAQEDNLREATFRYLFKNAPKDRLISAFYLSVQENKDPSQAFLRRFGGNSPPVRKASSLPIGSKEWMSYCISSIHWASDTHVTIDSGEVHSGMAVGIFLDCVLRNRRWEIRNTVISSA